MFGLLRNYRLLDLSPNGKASPVPSSPDNHQKVSYVRRNMSFMVGASVFGFACVTISSYQLLTENAGMIPLMVLLAYTAIYFVISQAIYFVSDDFDIRTHNALVRRWEPRRYPTVDVFLPSCGEPLDVLSNTWAGVRAMQRTYWGDVNVYCLDDACRTDVRSLALRFGFNYLSRPNRGWFKKAGNLRYAFERTEGDFIAIFDADFRPRADFLDELLPYFHEDTSVGIVQSPQYFDVLPEQNWVERGAGAVQELFYRAVQVSRHASQGAICVGSNAIYRRAALNDIGGTALIEHSEDVHTGFNLRMKGWKLKYVPVVLAKGLCPSDLEAFFKQQYRWCMGSMSLLTSSKFWKTRLPLMTRLCYGSGFMYYIHTAIYAVFTPVIPLVMLYAIPEQVDLANYLLILPSIIYMHIVFPLWHRAPYGIEAATVRVAYGWAHLVAVADKIRASAMEWQATGAMSKKKDRRYIWFRTGVVLFNFVPALFWVVGAILHIARTHDLDFVPMLMLGIYYLFVVLKIVVYRDARAEGRQANTGRMWAWSRHFAASTLRRVAPVPPRAEVRGSRAPGFQGMPVGASHPVPAASRRAAPLVLSQQTRIAVPFVLSSQLRI